MRSANDHITDARSTGRRRVNGVELHVVEAGPADGPLLMLLHGFPEFWWGWRRQIAPLAARGFRVVVPDMRGYNLSDKPGGVAAYTLDALVADVIALADASAGARGRPGLRLVGHDWGGVVAWGTAQRHPDRVERLVILNAPPPGVWAREVFRHPTQALRSAYVAFFQLPWLPEATLTAGDFALLRRGVRRSARPDTFAPGELDRYAEAWARPGALTAMINYYRALRHQGARAATRVRPPTLILWGAEDAFLGRHIAEAGLGLCDDGRVRYFDAASHWLHLDEADAVSAAVAEFCGVG